MNPFKKLGALIGASALTGVAIFVGAVGVANAAPVTLTIEPSHVAPGGSISMTVNDCSIGATLETFINGVKTEAVQVITPGLLPITEALAYDLVLTVFDLEPGETGTFSAMCTPAEGSGEAVSSVSETITVFGSSYIEVDPDPVCVGETLSVTAGDFMPGTVVTLYSALFGTEDVAFSATLGTAGTDFAVTGDVVIPAGLESGTYLIELGGDDDDEVIRTEVEICDAPEPGPSPSPPVSVSPSPSPSPSASVSPSSSPSPSASVSPSVTALPTVTVTTTRPSRPGLPNTGN